MLNDEHDAEDAAAMAIIERLAEIQKAKRFRSEWCIDDVTDLEALSTPHPFTTAHTLTYTTLRYGDRPAITSHHANQKVWPVDGPLERSRESCSGKVARSDHRFVEDFYPTSEPGVLLVRLGS